MSIPLAYFGRPGMSLQQLAAARRLSRNNAKLLVSGVAFSAISAISVNIYTFLMAPEAHLFLVHSGHLVVRELLFDR